MGAMSNEKFFEALTSLFQSRKAKTTGSIYLTQKRLSYPSSTSASASASVPLSLADMGAELNVPHPLLVRATNGKGKHARADKIKLSTVVESDALAGFFERYAEVCKAGMTTLKPRDRSRRKGNKNKKRKGNAGAAATAIATGTRTGTGN